MFQTCLQHIFKMLQYRKDKGKLFQYAREHREELKRMDHVETMAMVTLLGEQRRLERILDSSDRKEVIDMDSALTELIMDGKVEGKAETEIHLIRRKIKQDFPKKEIADWMELDENYVGKIAKLLELYPGESDTEIARRILKCEGEVFGGFYMG